MREQNYSELQPVERFRLLVEKYESNEPVVERKLEDSAEAKYLDALDVVNQIIKGKDTNQITSDDFTLTDLPMSELNEVRCLVKRAEYKRFRSPQRKSYLEDIRRLLYSAPIVHTDAFYTYILKKCDKAFIKGTKIKDLMTPDDDIFTDPYGIGGLFHPNLSQVIEMMVYSRLKGQNQVVKELRWMLSGSLGKDVIPFKGTDRTDKFLNKFEAEFVKKFNCEPEIKLW